MHLSEGGREVKKLRNKLLDELKYRWSRIDGFRITLKHFLAHKGGYLLF